MGYWIDRHQAFRDSELGLVRLRAFGVYNIQVVQPALFISRLVGTMAQLTTADVEEYLKTVIVSRLNDYLGEHLGSLFALPGKYEEISNGLQKRLRADFSNFGLALSQLYITAITPPPDVQQAIDDRSRMSAVGDLDKLIKMKAAMAMEQAAANPGGAAAGLGMGVGMMMPALLRAPPTTQVPCPECQSLGSIDAHFCSGCGHQLVVFDRCGFCGKNLSPNAKYCSRCGHTVAEKPVPRVCAKCGSADLPGAVFCNQCGQKFE